MRSGFAYEMQNEAERLAKPFGKKIHGVKCWYSAARLFDAPAERVFVSINPGGDKPDPPEDQLSPYVDSKHNAWLDQDWDGHGPGGSNHQKLADRVFEALYGACGKNVLRKTPSFPVAPFRTPRASMLPKCAWRVAVPWFCEVLEHLIPRVVICNGNNENMSPWSVLRKRYEVKVSQRIELGGTASLKKGIIRSGILCGTKILAIPHLTGARYSREKMLKAVEACAGEY